MNKTAKGALAASAAAALLLGGAGTLAYWNDDAVVNGGSVNSGYLEINPTVVSPNTTPCDASWKHTNGPKSGTTVVNIVPGDVITKNCTFVVRAKGDNLEAAPTVPATIAYTASSTVGAGAPTTLSLPVAATYTLGATPLTGNITELDDTKVLTAKIQVSFPYDATHTANLNDTQNLLVSLQDLTVSLTQNNKGA